MQNLDDLDPDFEVEAVGDDLLEGVEDIGGLTLTGVRLAGESSIDNSLPASNKGSSAFAFVLVSFPAPSGMATGGSMGGFNGYWGLLRG